MADLYRTHDWSTSPLGEPATWPERLRAAVQLMLANKHLMFVAWGPDLAFLYNDGYRPVFGQKHPWALGRPFKEVWSEIWDDIEPLVDTALSGEATWSENLHLVMERNGYPEDTWYTFSYSPLRDDGGAVAGMFCAGSETTEAVLAERRVRESEERFRNMADNAPMMMWVTDADGRCTYLNRAWYAFTGQSEEEGEGFGWLEPVHPDDRGWSEETFRAANARSEAFRLEYRLRRHDGAYRWALDAASPRFGPDGEFMGYIGSVVDIDDRREAEDALRDSEARYRTLFNTIDEGFCVIEFLDGPHGPLSDYVHVEANEAYAANAGIPDIVGKRLREIVSDSEADAWSAIYRAVLVSGEPVRFERELAETGRFLELAAFRVEPPDRRQVAVLFKDVTDRRQAEDRLREINEDLEERFAESLAERQLLADLVEGTDAFVQVVDPQYRWLAINRAATSEFERIYGVRPAVGDSILDLLGHLPAHRDEVRAIWARALDGEEFTEVGEFGDEARDRRSYEMKYNVLRGKDGELIGAYQFVYDVTERVREQRKLADAQEQLRQSQKMEALGQLTGGVAHDFNNLLTPIVGALDMLQRAGLGGEREQRLIDGALQSSDRAKMLVQRLLAFARRQPLQSAAVDVAELVTGMADLLASTSGPQIRVVVEAADDLPLARADANQLEMALLNLGVNARDAMPDGGTLRISATAEQVRGGHRSGLKAGDYVRLSVADTGVGMDEEVAARAVEPFFSTKGIGKGTGLGLSMVHGLASQLGGALTIDSRPGVGTDVSLWLPQTKADTRPAKPREDLLVRGGTKGQVLLVDDEDLVRVSTAGMLADLGYSVIEARSGEEACQLVADGLTPSLLVTDHLMPGMSGTELARKLLEKNPVLPVLVVSGFTELEGIASELPRLTKPFRNADLAQKLAAIEQGQAG